MPEHNYVIVRDGGPPKAARMDCVSQTSAYRLRIRTDSADSNGLMLLDEGELVAILIELADEGHGDARGKWVIETTFGLDHAHPPLRFNCAGDAAAWVSDHISDRPFILGGNVVELR